MKLTNGTGDFTTPGLFFLGLALLVFLASILIVMIGIWMEIHAVVIRKKIVTIAPQVENLVEEVENLQSIESKRLPLSRTLPPQEENEQP